MTTPSRGPAPRPQAAAPPPPPPRGEQVESVGGNRKLIRPQLAAHGGAPASRAPSRPRPAGPAGPAARAAPEVGWHERLAGRQATLAITLEDGQVLRGTLDWYDRDCLKLRRADGPDLVVMKHAILHVAREEAGVASGPAASGGHGRPGRTGSRRG